MDCNQYVHRIILGRQVLVTVRWNSLLTYCMALHIFAVACGNVKVFHLILVIFSQIKLSQK